MIKVNNDSPVPQNAARAIVAPANSDRAAANSGNALPVENNIAVMSARADKHAEIAENIRENIEAAVVEMNAYTQATQRDLQFSLDDSSGRVVVTVIDRVSQEVIRQIPDDVFLRLARNLKESRQHGSDEPVHFINARA